MLNSKLVEKDAPYANRCLAAAQHAEMTMKLIISSKQKH